MTISIGNLTLPDGLVWSDEFSWAPISQSTTYTLTGALIVHESEKKAGRPITLTSQQDGKYISAWVTRAWLLAFYTALTVPNTTFTLTLHDGRQFTVTAIRSGNGPITAVPIGTIQPANPDDNYKYRINEIRLMEVSSG